jgi:NAD(P)-dependent dehydrogenase (short-subunit alcohol dehydrogenase family)
MVYARGMTEQPRDTRRQASVLKCEGTGWDVGGAVRFLLSDQARYVTGRLLVVDGGATLVGPSRASQ